VLGLWRRATTAPKGRPKNGDPITIKRVTGTSKAYLLDRLQRD
jgi:hypothetical protein